jgi:hypothetical protein
VKSLKIALATGSAMIVSSSQAQYQTVALQKLLSEMIRKGSLPATKQVLPGSEIRPQVPKDTSKLPPGDESDREIEIVRFGGIRNVGSGKIALTGGAEIVGRGYRCLADSIEGDRNTEVYRCIGNVRIIGKDSTVTGESVTVNFKSKTFFATYGIAQISPNLVGNQITGDAFLKGKEAGGTSQKIKGKECEFTTCNETKPHFHLDSKEAELKPQKEIIFKKVKLNILGGTVIELPVLWIPLGERTFKYLPQVGQTPDEGLFIKNTYGFPMKGEDRGAIRLDWMQKLGTGIGGNYYYRNKDSNGIAKLYGVVGNINTVSLSNQHEQRFNWGDLTLENDVQRANYLISPESTLISTRANLRLKGNTTIGFNRQEQATGGFSNFNQTLTLNDQRRFGGTNTSLDMTLSRSGGSIGAERQTLDVRFQGNRETSLGTASLEYQRTIPIGDVANFFPASDRTPVVSLRSTSKQLLGKKEIATIPFRTELNVGEYLDPIQQSRISRGVFDLNYNRQVKDAGPWKWDSNGGYRQNVYSDDTAQYRLSFGNTITYRVDKQISANLRHSYLRPFGYSPLAIDRTGQNNLFTFDLSVNANSKSQFGLQTGYDLIRADQSEVPWQQVGIRSDYRLSNAFSLRTLSTYDTFQQVWSNVRIDTTWQTPTLSASFGARYDAINQKWANLNAFIEGIEFGKTRIGAVFNYNGFTNQFDSQQYNIVYDLHCFEAILTVSDFGTGFRAGQEIGFFVRLKAIPFDTNFGRGRRGQALGSGTGRDF